MNSSCDNCGSDIGALSRQKDKLRWFPPRIVKERWCKKCYYFSEGHPALLRRLLPIADR